VGEAGDVVGEVTGQRRPAQDVAASTGMRCGAASGCPGDERFAQRPAGPSSTRAATITEASTTAVTGGRVAVAEDALGRERGPGAGLAFPDAGHQRAGVGPAGEFDELRPEVLLQRSPRPGGPGGPVLVGLVRNVADRDGAMHALCC